MPERRQSHDRRVTAMQGFIMDALQNGAKIQTGCERLGESLALAQVPFGGIQDSGYGSEGGAEAIGANLNDKSITQAGL